MSGPDAEQPAATPAAQPALPPAPQLAAGGAVGRRDPAVWDRARFAHVESLHHLGLSRAACEREFADVLFVCVCGTDDRALEIARAIAARVPGAGAPRELGRSRFVVYKVGQAVVSSHGMGGPSISICLNELLQALIMAENRLDVVFFRIGTTGGLGVPAGSVVCSTEALNEDLEPCYEVVYMGRHVSYATQLDAAVCAAIAEQCRDVVLGKTMTANCFYENQGRLDGAFCDHSAADKDAFLRSLHARGVRNIEMEVVPFSAIVHRAGLRAVACCVVLVNRLEDEHPKELVNANRSIAVVADYIAGQLHPQCP
jgi:uridine phosphorylase